MNRADREMSDTDLVLAIGAGDQVAFAALYDRYHVPAYQLAYLLLGERETSEEAVLAVFLHLWRRASSYDPATGSVRSWLLTDIRRTATNWERVPRTLPRHESRSSGVGIAQRREETCW